MASGAEIKRLRLLDGKKSAAVVAALIGVDAERMRKWESNNTDPQDTEDIRKVEFYFGKPLHELENLETFQFVKKVTGENENDFKALYYAQIKENNDILKKSLDERDNQINKLKEEIIEVKRSLDLILKNQVTMVAMGRGVQDTLFEKLSQSPAEKKNLLRTAHNKGVALVRVLKKTDNLVDMDSLSNSLKA